MMSQVALNIHPNIAGIGTLHRLGVITKAFLHEQRTTCNIVGTCCMLCHPCPWAVLNVVELDDLRHLVIL